jgi:hypothetical protein
LEGNKNERELNSTANVDRPIQEKEANSDDAPIRNELAGKRFENGTPLF